MFKTLLAAALVLVFATSAQAVLFRVGPNRVPSPPGNGYPLWYQDTNGLAMDLCLPRNPAQLNAGVCLITNPTADPIAGLNLPIVFPSNYPDEAFYFNATGVFDLDATPPPGITSTRATMVLALEAAFGGLGTVAPGAQITFGRVRFTIDAPVSGDYTITYPFGVLHFPGVVAGNEAIKFTDDIGIGAVGDFTGALQSGVGPFLQKSATGLPGGPPAAPINIGGDLFLSDAATEVAITGSPNNTNYFEVCVDAGTIDGLVPCKRLNVFTLMGKVHPTPIPSPFVVNSATYARDGVSAHVNVAATASPGPNTLVPKLFFGDAAGTNLIPSTLMNGPSNLNQFFGQSIPTNAATLPASVIVTNASDNPPASITRALVDEVTLTATYNTTTRQLTINATTSDKVAPVPALVAVGLPGSLTGSDPLGPIVVAGDAAAQQLVYPIPAAVAQLPPPSVTVTSPKGGKATAVVSTATGAAGDFAAGGPIAINDVKLIKVGALATQLAINVLQNDIGAAPATVRIIKQPKKGTLTVNPTTGNIVYTFTGAKVLGNDSFTYTVRNAAAPAGIESNVATVTVKTVP